MNIKFTICAAAAAAFMLAPSFFAKPAEAAPTYIQCPVPSVQTRVITRLPPGWNVEGQEQRLRSARVQELRGDRQILECNYDGGLKLTLPGPFRLECQVESRTGFKCDRPVRRLPVTHYTAEEVLNPGEVLNLDGARRGSPFGDIWLDGVTLLDARLSTFGDATMAMPGRQQGYEGCSRQRYQNRSIRITELREGDYVCVKTNEGRYSEFRINNVDLRGFVKVRLGFTTWR